MVSIMEKQEKLINHKNATLHNQSGEKRQTATAGMVHQQTSISQCYLFYLNLIICD